MSKNDLNIVCDQGLALKCIFKTIQQHQNPPKCSYEISTENKFEGMVLCI